MNLHKKVMDDGGRIDQIASPKAVFGCESIGLAVALIFEKELLGQLLE